MARLRQNGRALTLAPVRPNAGIRAAYRKRLLALVEEMAASYEKWLLAIYRRNTPKMTLATDAQRQEWARYIEPEPPPLFERDPAEVRDPLLAINRAITPPGHWVVMDESPAKELERELRRLGKRWGKRFDEAAEEMAAYFAKSSARRSDAQMRSILKRGGWSVKFKMTAAMRDVMNATIAEQVGLIKSIPQQYHTEVEGLVMRSATAGRDLSTLSDELSARYAISRKRAELIARDQNNKMTASFTRVRQIEMGITEAIWLHSAGGKKPRRTHVAKSGKRYDVAKGWWDPDEKKYIWPGVLINCRCVSKPIVKGFS